MKTLTRHIVNQGGAISIEIQDEQGGLVELIPGDSGLILDTFGLSMLDEEGVTVVIDALTRWKECRRLV